LLRAEEELITAHRERASQQCYIEGIKADSEALTEEIKRLQMEHDKAQLCLGASEHDRKMLAEEFEMLRRNLDIRDHEVMELNANVAKLGNEAATLRELCPRKHAKTDPVSPHLVKAWITLIRQGEEDNALKLMDSYTDAC
jgi:chromosome segregation ATPase